ncbi:MAG: metallopeptidase family protein [Nakamurella sp.]
MASVPPIPDRPGAPRSAGGDERRRAAVNAVSAGGADPVVPTVDEARARRDRHDRRGRGLRRSLLSGRVPLARTRSERFDDAVLHAVDDLEQVFGSRLESLEFAVDEVPPVAADASGTTTVDAVLDGEVPLTRFVGPGVDRRGRPTRARVIVYRRPIEHRSTDPEDLEDLILDLLREQVAAVLGEPEDH